MFTLSSANSVPQRLRMVIAAGTNGGDRPHSSPQRLSQCVAAVPAINQKTR